MPVYDIGLSPLELALAKRYMARKAAERQPRYGMQRGSVPPRYGFGLPLPQPMPVAPGASPEVGVIALRPAEDAEAALAPYAEAAPLPAPIQAPPASWAGRLPRRTWAGGLQSYPTPRALPYQR